MARAISVKIPTGKVIEMIEQKIVEIFTEMALAIVISFLVSRVLFLTRSIIA